MNTRTRLLIGGLFYALMFFYVGLNLYLHAAGIGSYDGWTAQDDGTGRMVVTAFDPNGPASILQIGDVFLAINGLTRKEDPDIVNYSGRLKAGTPYRMTVMRSNAVLELLLHTVPYPPEKRRNDYKLIVAAIVRLMFLLPGFFLLVAKPDDRQAWLLALLFGAFGSLLGDTLNPLHFGRGVELLCSLARILSFLGFPFFVLFFLNFPQPSPWLQRNRWFNWYIYLPLLLFVLPTFGASRLPGYLQTAFFQHPLIKPLFRGGWFVGIAKWMVVGYLAAGLLCLALNYRIAQPDARRRARVAILGSSIGFLFLLALIVLEFNGGQAAFPRLWRVFDLITPYVTPLIPLSFTYAIIRYKVIPISLIIRRGVRYVLVSRGAIIIETLIAVALAVLYVKTFFQIWDLKLVMLSAAVSIAAWKLIDRAHRRYIAPAIDRRFFRQSYDAQRLIGELSDSLRMTNDLPRLLELLATRLQAALQTESVNVLLKDEASGEFRSTYACAYDRTSGHVVNCGCDDILPAFYSTITALKQSDAPIEIEWSNDHPAYGGNGSYAFSSQELQTLQTMRPALFLPLKVKGELSGVVALGARLGDLPFSTEDKRLIQSVGAPTTLALENARLVEGMITEARRREELEAENEARARELEEARQLQLSMLPKHVPQLPHLEIAAYMKTATEVGGDYYDFHLSKSASMGDGILTVAIGDATGHGLKAGTVVTAMKSLFYTLAFEPSLAEVLNQSSRVLKAMNLRSLFMALTLVKLEDNDLRIASAGMPPALLYRRETNEVEEILMKTMPLGSLRDYAYREQSIVLASGDVLMLMSDGFPERFNAAGEMLGFDKGADVLRTAHSLTATQIVAQFIQAEDQWAQGFAQNDDVTFVVLKVK